MRRAANVDANATAVTNAFRGLGCSVEPTHMVGRGFPDLVVGVAGINLLVELKAFPAHTEKGRLSDEQQAWHDAWRGQVCVVRSLEDVGRLVESVRAWREVAPSK